MEVESRMTIDDPHPASRSLYSEEHRSLTPRSVHNQPGRASSRSTTPPASPPYPFLKPPRAPSPSPPQPHAQRGT
eukprot:CAMPEP_0206165588 /NCGR_PEP_ID=MMETSP1474-20131121/20886_1 /ASSEMBLY_ACC=CAM_ASM_001110 /TAXON_ID=97495 /ORGANISM="Imantonia sp., Strain RCC918" /LENGTH=74 /DNA_ID=CAMNT_0053569069 /DNA_START=64 /DNA_END=284 /DNA_ORIENTATION=+